MFLINNKNASKITKHSKNSQQNNSKTVANEHDKEIPKYIYIYIYIYIYMYIIYIYTYIYIYISLKERQEIIDENSRIMEYQKITKVSKNSQQNNSEKVTND